MECRRLLTVLKKAYRNKYNIPGYARMTLFGENRNTLGQCSTPFLINWVGKYTEVVEKRRAYIGEQMGAGTLVY